MTLLGLIALHVALTAVYAAISVLGIVAFGWLCVALTRLFRWS